MKANSNDAEGLDITNQRRVVHAPDAADNQLANEKRCKYHRTRAGGTTRHGPRSTRSVAGAPAFTAVSATELDLSWVIRNSCLRSFMTLGEPMSGVTGPVCGWSCRGWTRLTPRGCGTLQRWHERYATNPHASPHHPHAVGEEVLVLAAPISPKVWISSRGNASQCQSYGLRSTRSKIHQIDRLRSNRIFLSNGKIGFEFWLGFRSRCRFDGNFKFLKHWK